MDDNTEESRWLSDGTMRRPEDRRNSFQGARSRVNVGTSHQPGDTEDPVRILPMEERVKNDYVFVLSKFAESFVGADELRMQVLHEELSNFKATNELELEHLDLKQQLRREQNIEEKTRKVYEKKQETYSKQISTLKKQIGAEKAEKLKMMQTMVNLLEKEKNTRERILEYMEDADEDYMEDKKETDGVKKDKLANHFEDVPSLD
jgi:hypothetical protein